MDATLIAARRVLGDMQAGLLPKWLSVDYSGGSVLFIGALNANQYPDSIAPHVEHLKTMFPDGDERHEFGEYNGGGTKRDVTDRWRYTALLEPSREHASREYAAKVIVTFARRHVDHDYRTSMTPYSGKPDEVELIHKCQWCGKRPTKKQAEALGLPRLVRP